MSQYTVLGTGNLAHGKVDEYVAVGVVIAGNGSRYAQHVPLKKSVIIPDGIGTVPESGGIEFLHLRLHPASAQAVHDNGSLPVDNPYFRPQILGQNADLGGDLRRVLAFPLVHIAVGCRDHVGFIIEGIRPLLNQVLPDHPGRKCRNCEKSQETENQVSQDKF